MTAPTETGERIAAGPLAPRNDRIVDVPMRAQRSLATVTAEILSYQEAARRMVITYSVEIGRRLVEAKGMVDHGYWGRYLREELGFSQSTANNHMRLFEAYAAGQMTLTGAAVNNQAFADLTYTQALELLALPAEEREAFVLTHDMSGMSTRELKEELRRREQATGNRQQATGDVGCGFFDSAFGDPQNDRTGDADCHGPDGPRNDSEGDADPSTGLEAGPPPLRAGEVITGDGENGSFDSGSASAQDDKNGDAERVRELTAQLAKANSRVIDAEAERDRILRETEESRGKVEQAEARARKAEENLTQAQADLKKAKAAEEKALKKYNDAKKDTTVPKETLDKLKAEAEAAAKKSFEADYEKLDAAQKEAAAARREAEAAARGLAALREEKERIEKELRAAAPEVAQFRFLFEGAQEALQRCLDALPGLPPDKVPGCTRAIKRLLESTLETLEANKWEAAMPE